jgi:hypothetical protein
MASDDDYDEEEQNEREEQERQDRARRGRWLNGEDNEDDARNTRRPRLDGSDRIIVDTAARTYIQEGDDDNTTQPTENLLPRDFSPPPTITGGTTGPEERGIGLEATLNRLFPHGFPQDITTDELKTQAEVKGESARIALFRTEVLQHQGVVAFGFLQPKDMTIHLLHSPATYYARGASGPLKGKDIGFVGDRTPFSSPAPVVLQHEKPWKWITSKIVTSELELEAFYANPNNKHKFFSPTAASPLDRVTVPRLLLLPSVLLKFCVDRPRTPLDMMRHVTTLATVMTPDPETPGAFTLQDFDLVLNWCAAALHSDKGDSLLKYDMQAAMGNETFHRWTSTRLDATLGPITLMEPRLQPQRALDQRPMAQTTTTHGVTHAPATDQAPTYPLPPHGTPPLFTPTLPPQFPTTRPSLHGPQLHARPTSATQAPQGITFPQPPTTQQPPLSDLALLAAKFGKGVMAALQPGVTAAQLGGATNTADKREYDVFQRAILQGFANTPTLAGLPHIWSLFCQTKLVDTHRLHIRDAMLAWAQAYGVSINRGMYLPKSVVEDIINLRFNPGGCSAYYSTAEKGISILLCCSRPGEDREAARQQELAEDLTTTCSLSEALTLGKSAPRAPPDTYSDLKALVATFCAFL